MRELEKRTFLFVNVTTATIRYHLVTQEAPGLNLPQKQFSSPDSPPRGSAQSLQNKRHNYVGKSTDTPYQCYKSFDEFKVRITGLRLPSWDNYLLTSNKVALFFTETNSRYFITRAIARVIIVREFVEVKKRHIIIG